MIRFIMSLKKPIQVYITISQLFTLYKCRNCAFLLVFFFVQYRLFSNLILMSREKTPLLFLPFSVVCCYNFKAHTATFRTGVLIHREHEYRKMKPLHYEIWRIISHISLFIYPTRRRCTLSRVSI